MSAFLHEFELHGPVLFKLRPLLHFCVSADHDAKLQQLICVSMTHAESETRALQWSRCRFMISMASVLLLQLRFHVIIAVFHPLL